MGLNRPTQRLRRELLDLAYHQEALAGKLVHIAESLPGRRCLPLLRLLAGYRRHESRREVWLVFLRQRQRHLLVHDELLIETAKEEVEEVSAILEREMRQAADLSVPLEVDMHTGENWYEAK